MSKLITSELKDQVLRTIVNEFQDMLGYVNVCKWAKRFKIHPHVLIAILYHFVDKNLIMISKKPNGYEVAITVEAHDFVSYGGFVTQEKLFQDNIKKLLFEIEKLKPSAPDTVATISSIVSNITATFGFLFQIK